MTSLALDLSNFDHPLTAAQAQEFLDSGVESVIIGCQRPVLAQALIDTCRRVGLRIAGVYSFIYFGLDTIGQTQAAIDVAKANGIKRVWLDVESSPPNESASATPESRAAELANCVAMVRNAGLEPGIYTYAPYWQGQMANTTAFSELPLWFAAYFNDRREVRAVDFGGWSAVAIHQYASDIPVAGRIRDHNYVFTEESMADPRVDALIAALGGQAEIDKWNANGNSLLIGYGLEQQKLADHIAAGGGTTGPVADHTHEPGKVKR